ncbi:MAG: hypothetical protein AAF567_16135 [Actinomycetota bacterium]
MTSPHKFRISAGRFGAVLVALALVVAACGSDPIELGTVVPATGGDGHGATADGGSSGSGTSPTEVPTTAPIGAPEDSSTPDSPDAEDPSPAPSTPVPTTPEPAPTPTLPPADSDQPVEQDVDPEPVDPDDGTSSSPAPPPDSEDTDDSIGWERVPSAPELLSPVVVEPAELLAGPDGRSVLVRFWNGVEPCSLARVTVTEAPSNVLVRLETGANPNAATMTCIALAAAYEIAVPLQSDLGTRELVAEAASPPVVDPPGPPLDAVFSVEQYLGLTEDEARSLAAVEGRDLRVARIDDEFFALTQDFIASRVNIEIEAGVVVSVFGG